MRTALSPSAAHREGRGRRTGPAVPHRLCRALLVVVLHPLAAQGSAQGRRGRDPALAPRGAHGGGLRASRAAGGRGKAGSEWGSGGDLPEGHPERHPAKGLSGSAGLELASSLEGHTRASSAGCRLGVTVLRRGSGHSSATLRASRPQANLVLSAKGQEERVLGHPSFTHWPCTRPPTPASVLPLALRFLLWPQNAPSPRPQVPAGTAPASAVCQGGAWPAGADLLEVCPPVLCAQFPDPSWPARRTAEGARGPHEGDAGHPVAWTRVWKPLHMTLALRGAG